MPSPNAIKAWSLLVVAASATNQQMTTAHITPTGFYNTSNISCTPLTMNYTFNGAVTISDTNTPYAYYYSPSPDSYTYYLQATIFVDGTVQMTMCFLGGPSTSINAFIKTCEAFFPDTLSITMNNISSNQLGDGKFRLCNFSTMGGTLYIGSDPYLTISADLNCSNAPATLYGQYIRMGNSFMPLCNAFFQLGNLILAILSLIALVPIICGIVHCLNKQQAPKGIAHRLRGKSHIQNLRATTRAAASDPNASGANPAPALGPYSRLLAGLATNQPSS